MERIAELSHAPNTFPVLHLSIQQEGSQAYIRRGEYGLEMSSGFTRLDTFGRQGDCLKENPNQPLCHCIGTTTP
ncbi:hypothetical protein ANCDUO_14144 [Ancylostoma duodenale]|uniref:Uncharacterized protein n=1 Tax=Ancylostoma duodenale TaxID=51022 RepID=A0A0C2CH38_9BILA|nr:hypothetical protein ANCDUO_14144 [Ancylostoma duodenale]